MMTQQIGFSVLSAPLAALDRRALSQAWYSALHVAVHQPVRETAAAFVGMTIPAASHAAPPREAPTRARALTASSSRTAVSPRGTPIESDRRTARSCLARKIERAFLHPARPLQRATFTIGENARVHVALQLGARGMHLVAVCGPKHRAAVSRALEEARYALASRGISLAVSLSGERHVR